MEISRLGDHYEHLRACALFSDKVPLQPLGLDLWIKNGSLSWIEAMLPKAAQEPGQNPAPRQGSPAISADFVLALVNILMERNGNNGAS